MITLDDDYRLEDFGIRGYQDHEHPATPEYRHKTMSIPGMSGRWDFGTELGSKPFNLFFKSIGKDRIGLQQKLNEFIAFLHDEYGRPRVIKVSFDYEPDKHYYIKVNEPITPERLMESNTYPVDFVADDPYKYATANEYDPEDEYNYNEEYLYDAGLMYDNPQSFEWKYEKHYSGINNYSPLVTDFIIEIQGTVSNGSITNTNNNTKLTLPNISNGRLLINGKTFSVIKNGQAILEGSNYNFFHIQTGEVGFLFEGDNPNATVTYKWQHKFM